MPSIINRDEDSGAIWTLPGKCDEGIPGAVPVPGGRAFQQPPFAIADCRAAEHFERAGVKLIERFVHWFLRCATEVR